MVATSIVIFDILPNCEWWYKNGKKYHHNTDTHHFNNNGSKHHIGYYQVNISIDLSGQNYSGNTTYGRPYDALVFYKNVCVPWIPKTGLGKTQDNVSNPPRNT